MGNPVGGTAYIKADGNQFTVAGSVEVPLMDVKRETILAGGHYTENDLIQFVKFEAITTSDFPIDQLRNNTEMTLTVELKNGMVYVLTGAYIVGEPSINGSEGKSSLEFNGKKGYFQ
jgi:Phage tail tube protein